MGSTISYNDCPLCGSHDSYVSDYYYRSGEEFCVCSECGYEKSITLSKRKKVIQIPFEDIYMLRWNGICFARDNTPLEKCIRLIREGKFRSPDCSYIIKGDYEGCDYSLMNGVVHPQKRTVEIRIGQFKKEETPGHGVIRYKGKDDHFSTMEPFRKYPGKKTIRNIFENAKRDGWVIEKLTRVMNGKIEYLAGKPDMEDIQEEKAYA